MTKRSRGGRRRMQGERYPSGDLRSLHGAPREALERRAERAGCTLEDAAKRPEAGYALGQLLVRGTINQHQHDAGMAYRQAWMRWASLAGLPPHETTQRGHGRAGDEVDGAWTAVKQAYTWATDAVLQCEHNRLVLSAIETVIMDNVLPPLFPHRWVAVAALRAGLDALADYYRFPRRDAA